MKIKLQKILNVHIHTLRKRNKDGGLKPVLIGKRNDGRYLKVDVVKLLSA